MRSTLLALGCVLVAACGGSQKAGGGEAFCDSYQDNYLASCQQQCETLLEAGDAEGQKACASKCREDLRGDDTFVDSCPERLPKLAG